MAHFWKGIFRPFLDLSPNMRAKHTCFWSKYGHFWVKNGCEKSAPLFELFFEWFLSTFGRFLINKHGFIRNFYLKIFLDQLEACFAIFHPALKWLQAKKRPQKNSKLDFWPLSIYSSKQRKFFYPEKLSVFDIFENVKYFSMKFYNILMKNAKYQKNIDRHIRAK